MTLLGSLFFAAESGCQPARDQTASARDEMIEQQLKARGIADPKVLEAIAAVPREEFVPDDLRSSAHSDSPLPIGHAQTISQPYIVALMTELLRLKRDDKVLEIGTGSGYQAAILARLTPHVYTIEIVPALAKQAQQRLPKFGIPKSRVIEGDGYRGLPEEAPFDAIIVTAAPEKVPQPLLDQLKPGGRLVIPVGPVGTVQELLLIEKSAAGELRRRTVLPVQFVPMTGGGSDEKRR